MIETNPTAFLAKSFNEMKLRSQLEQLAGHCKVNDYQADQTMGWGIKWNPIKDIAKAVNSVGKFINNAAIGLGKSIEGVGQSVFHGVEHFGETLALTARAAVGDVKWDRVLREAGKVTNEIGNILVLSNPVRYTTEIGRAHV